ncbi:hypothetical protein Tco_0024616 [Tanacetum coccineum]
MSNRKSSSISPTLGYLPRFLKENCCLRSNLPAEGQSSNALARCSWWGSMETLDFLWPQLLFLNGLIDPLYNVYCKTTTAKELWESLERKYKTEDAGTKKFVVARFLDYKMVDSKNVISQVQDLQRKRWGVLRLGSSSFVLERDNKLGLRKGKSKKKNGTSRAKREESELPLLPSPKKLGCETEVIGGLATTVTKPVPTCWLIARCRRGEIHVRAVWTNGQKLYMGNSATADNQGVEGGMFIFRRWTIRRERAQVGIMSLCSEIRKNSCGPVGSCTPESPLDHQLLPSPSSSLLPIDTSMHLSKVRLSSPAVQQLWTLYPGKQTANLFVLGKSYDYLSRKQFEHPILAAHVAAPGHQVPPEALAAYAAWVKGSKEIEEGQSVSSYVLKMKSYIDNLERLGQPVSLHLAASLILVSLSKEYDDAAKERCCTSTSCNKSKKDPKNQKKKPHKAAKGNQRKGKEKMGYAPVPTPSFAPKPKNPLTPKKDNSAKDAIYHQCDYGTHICITTQGLKGSRKLKPGALSLYVGDGHRAGVEAIG